MNVAEATTISEVINTIELNTNKQIDEIVFDDLGDTIHRISFYYDEKNDWDNDLSTLDNCKSCEDKAGFTDV